MSTIMILFMTLLLQAGIIDEISVGSIQVEVTDLKNTEGQLGVLVFEKNDGYPEDFKKALRSTLVPIEADTMTVVIEDLPYGDYVVTVMHDKNSNDKLDKNFFGKPKEGTGVSNNPNGRKFGPPKFENGIIQLSEDTKHLSIKMKY